MTVSPQNDKAKPKARNRTRKTSDRRWGTSKLGKLMGKDARRAFRKFGFSESAVITRWRAIVGDDLAEYSVPLKLWFKKGQKTEGTLHIMVEGAHAIQMHHLAPLIIEKVNIFYGYRAVGSVNITQGPVKGRRAKKRREVPGLDEVDQAKLDAMVENTRDDDLKGALKRLGKRILGTNKS